MLFSLINSTGAVLQAGIQVTPYTVIPAGCSLIPYVAPAPTFADTQLQYTVAIQAHLDATAQSKGYDGILSLCSYVSSTNSTYAAQAKAGLDWRDNVWAYANNLLASVKAGTTPAPTEAALIAELPTITWP